MRRHPVPMTVTALSAVAAVGCAALAVGHLGIEVPILSSLGPPGSAAVVPAAVAFTCGAVVLTVVAVGAYRARAWAWALGLVVHSLVILGALMPFRGPVSLVAVLVSGVAVALLLTAPGRRAFRDAPIRPSG